MRSYGITSQTTKMHKLNLAVLLLASTLLFSCSKNSSAPLPKAAFTFSGEGIAPASVFFVNNSTGATSYSWNFGDGQTSTLATPAHAYINNGIYPVTLTATNSTGSNSFTDTVKVEATKLLLSSITLSPIPSYLLGDKIYIVFKIPSVNNFTFYSMTVTSPSLTSGLNWAFGASVPTISDFSQQCQIFVYEQVGSSQSPSTDPVLLGTNNFVNFSTEANQALANNSYPTSFQYNSVSGYYNQIFFAVWE